MRKLHELLRWPVDSEMADRYEAGFREAAERRLSSALSEIHAYSMEGAGSIVRVAAGIPSNSLLRLAHAPELEFRLRGARVAEDGRKALAAFLCEALQAELLLLDDRVGTPHAKGVWTALGDIHIGAELGNRQEGSQLDETPWIDFDSPHNRGDIANRFPDYKPPSQDDRNAIIAALREAMTLIAVASPAALRFTKAFTRVVVCIDVPDLDSQYGSFSSSWYPGRSVIINAQRMDVHELAAALVHEAIHSLIDVSEIGGLLLRRPAPGTTVTSPWTGATLSLQSLLDAYFVWYGLLWFWRRALASGVVDAIAAEKRIELARRGFEPELAMVVGSALQAVHGVTVDAIEGLRFALHQEASPA